MPNWKRILSFFKHHTGVCVIVLCWLVIVVTNLPGSNTWLLGWDNLVPELDLKLNIQRSIFAAWEEYQGLGLLGGIGHASEFTRQLLLLPFSLVLPTASLRYIWTFAMLLLGPLGMYACARVLLPYVSKPSTRTIVPTAALVASLFYLFNLGTVQNFYAPLESFSSFYGFFPWLLWSILEYWSKPSGKLLRRFFLISLAATSAFHVQTMFVVYTIVLAIFSIENLASRNQDAFKHTLLIWLTVVVVNAFWLLPVGYFTLTNGRVTVESKQNRIGTPETQLQNRAYGSLDHSALLEGYWFDYTDASNGETVFLMGNWKKHVENPIVRGIGYALFTAAILGLIWYGLSKKNRLSPLVVSVFSLSMLSSGKGAFGVLFNLLSTVVPLFSQIFRTPFTKWVVIASFTYALGLAFFISALHSLRVLHRWSRTAAALLLALAIFMILPLFKHQLLYDKVEVALPQAYLNLFAHMKSAPKQARILYLPTPTLWGWNFYTWGYRGSGFLWYGIEQPIVDRNFDVWSSTNETFYRQLITAFQQRDAQTFNSLLAQYDISYVLVDQSITTATQQTQESDFDTWESLLSQAGIEIDWQDDFLTLYRVGHSNHFLSSPTTYSLAKNDVKLSRFNPVFQSVGPYLSIQNDDQSSIILPFSELLKESPGKQLRANDSGIVFDVPIEPSNSMRSLLVPLTEPSSVHATPSRISLNGNRLSFQFPPEATIEAGDITVGLGQLQNFDIELAEIYDTAVLEFDGTPIYIGQGKTIDYVLTSIRRDMPLSFRYFDASKAMAEGNEITIHTDDIRTAFIPDAALSKLTDRQVKIAVAAGVKNIAITVPAWQIPLVIYDPKTAINCDAFKRGTFSKEVSGTEVRYIAENTATICDGLATRQGITELFNVFKLSSNNINGRSIKFYIEDMSDHTVVLEDLQPSGAVSQLYTIPAREQTKRSSYWINFETRSFGDDTAINSISEATLFPLSIDIKRLSMAQLVTDSTSTISSVSTLKGYEKWGTSFYRATVGNEQSLITLSQSYDSGWVAFSLDQPSIPLAHQLYNGWSNAWSIPVGSTGDRTIIIFYWPQLLIFVGYGLIILVFVYYLYHRLQLRARTDARLPGGHAHSIRHKTKNYLRGS